MTRAASVQSIPIASIRADLRAQPRAAMFHDVVGEYAEAMADGAVFPPTVVFEEDGVFWLADGFHRYHGAVGAELETIAAEVRQGGIRDAILYSCGANAAHGLRRTNDDKRRAVMRLIEDPEWAAWSDREIARRCGVGPDMVGRLRPAPPSVAERQIEPRLVSRGGTTYTQNTAGIGRVPREPEPGSAARVISGEELDGRHVIAPRSAEPASPAASSVLDAYRSEQGRMYLWHALKAAVAAVEELGDPNKAASDFPSTLAYSVDADQAEVAGRALCQFADAWRRRTASGDHSANLQSGMADVTGPTPFNEPPSNVVSLAGRLEQVPSIPDLEAEAERTLHVDGEDADEFDPSSVEQRAHILAGAIGDAVRYPITGKDFWSIYSRDPLAAIYHGHAMTLVEILSDVVGAHPANERKVRP